MGMFVVAPASFHQNNNHQHQNNEPIISNTYSINGSNPATALGVGVGVGLGVIPILTGPIDDDDDVLSGETRNGGIQLWQQNQNFSHFFKKATNLNHGNSSSVANFVHTGCGFVGSGSGSTNSIASCQDCGNQSKKDCIYRRCRTCCKSRGFDCTTHVKSTWVPASRRRERQLKGAAGGGSTGSKKPRLVVASQTTTTSHTSTSNNTPPDTSSSHQDMGFKDSIPSQVKAPAVFKCVRVTSVEDGEDEIAYQAMVKIQGRVYKGILYNQGVENRDGFPNISELNLGGGRNYNNGAFSSSAIIDPSDHVYAASDGGVGLLGACSTYGNPMN